MDRNAAIQQLDEERTSTLEAFADTIVPGEKRWDGDRAIAGAAAGGGAVAAGALDLLQWDATGVSDGIGDLAVLLNAHAVRYAEEHGLAEDSSVPAFVALAFEHRTALVQQLTARGHPEREFWVLLALFSNMAFDSAAHLPTAQALADGHPGLVALGMTPPDADGLWRFETPGYGRELAAVHPLTTPSGSPA